MIACRNLLWQARVGLEVAHRIDGGAVDPDLEVEVVAEAAAGAADVADHVALADAARGDREARTGGRNRSRARRRGRCRCSCRSRRWARRARSTLPSATARIGVPAGSGDVDALVHAAPARPERRDDRAVDGPDEAARGLALDRAGRQGRRRRSRLPGRPGAGPGCRPGCRAMSPSRRSMFSSTESSASALAARAALELGLAGLELRCGCARARAFRAAISSRLARMLSTSVLGLGREGRGRGRRSPRPAPGSSSGTRSARSGRRSRRPGGSP